MKFTRIFVESHLVSNPYTQRILEYFPHVPVTQIDKVENYWGRYKKAYLEKRDNLWVYIGQKRGQLVKVAPNAYGLSGEPHYYFVHAYNCIYECQYCYLQGYFQTPDLVFFVNHNEIIHELQQTLDQHQGRVWFHAGEFSDSLAMCHITGELANYFSFFRTHSRAMLELRTKSVNIKPLLALTPTDNVIVSFSLSPEEECRQVDLHTPSLSARLSAMAKLSAAGYRLAIHFDPIIFTESVIEKYQTLVEQVSRVVPLAHIQYFSLGVVRFTKEVYREVERNYPSSFMAVQKLIRGADQKVRYQRPLRLWLLKTIRQHLLQSGVDPERIYLCMEDED